MDKNESIEFRKLLLYIAAITFVGGLLGGLASIAGELMTDSVMSYLVNDLALIERKEVIYVGALMFGLLIGITVGFLSGIKMG